MDPLIGAGLISAGASLFGGLFANRENDRRVAEQNRLNYQMFKEQNAYNERMWHMNNAYNTPLEQRRRYEEAGINPFLALGNITPGVAQGVTSASPAPAMRADYRDPVAPAVSQGVESYIASLQAEKLKAEVDGANIDNQNKQRLYDDNSNLSKSQAALNYDNAFLSKIQAGRIDELLEKEKERMSSDIALVNSQVELNKLYKDLEKFKLDKVLPQEANKLKAEIAHLGASIVYLRQMGALTEEQTKAVAEGALLTIAQRKNVTLDSYSKTQLLEPTMKYINSQTRANNAQASYTSAREGNMTFENVTTGINTAVRVVDVGIRGYSAYKTGGASETLFSQNQQRIDQAQQRISAYQERTQAMQAAKGNKFPYRPR